MSGRKFDHPDEARSVDAEAVFICSNKDTVSGIEGVNVAACSYVYISLSSPSIIHLVLQALYQ